MVVSYLGYESGKEALTQSSFNHLTSLRVSKAGEIQRTPGFAQEMDSCPLGTEGGGSHVKASAVLRCSTLPCR